MAVGLAIAAVIPYLLSAYTPFLFDDRPAIERNETIRRLWPLTTPLSPPVNAAGAAGRPITNLSFAINYAVGGLDARGYHLVNIGIHALAVLTLWGLVRRSFTPAGTPAAEAIAGGAALLWALHPLQTESVVCVVQRNELLVALFYLLTLYGLVRSTEAKRPLFWQGMALTACLLGMASKEVMATAPLVVFLYDRTFVSGSFRAAWRRHAKLHLALASTWILLAWLMLNTRQRADTVGFGLGVSSWQYLLTQADALTTYIKLAVWPHPLVFDYGTALASGPVAVWVQGLVVLVLISVAAVAFWRCRALGFSGLVFFLVLAPSSSVVPLTTQPLAEHRMYLPLAAILVLMVATVRRYTRKVWIFVTPVAMVFATLTVRRTADYRSEARLWEVTIAQRPENARAHASLAGVRARSGHWLESLPRYEAALRLQPDYADAQNDYALALAHSGRTPDALRHHEIAWRLKPDDPDIRANLGLALVAAGQPAAAIPHLEAIVNRQPNQPVAHNNLGDALLKSGHPEEALRQFSAALAIDPDNFAAHNNAAVALAALKREAEALTHFIAAARLDPRNFDVRLNLGDALLRAGRTLEATEHYTIALETRPEVAELHYNLGNVWLELGQVSRAIERLETAVRLRPEWAAAHHNLALALVRAGQATEAIPHYRETLRQMPDSAQVHHNLALALAAAGLVAQAIQHEEDALRLQPNFPAARRHLDQLRSR